MVSLRTPEPEWRGDVTFGDEYAESPSASRTYDPCEIDPVVRSPFEKTRCRARTHPRPAFAPRSSILLLFLARFALYASENCRVTSIPLERAR